MTVKASGLPGRLAASPAHRLRPASGSQEVVDGVEQAYTASDVQVEFVMLDPFVCKTLLPDGNGNLATEFKAGNPSLISARPLHTGVTTGLGTAGA